MSLVSPDKFQHILRVQNTNIDGTRNIMFAMTAIRGIGRRFSNLICKKADIDLSKVMSNHVIILLILISREPVNSTTMRSNVWKLSCSTHVNTRSQTGSSIDKRTGKTVHSANAFPTVSILSSVKIWSD